MFEQLCASKMPVAEAILRADEHLGRKHDERASATRPVRNQRTSAEKIRSSR